MDSGTPAKRMPYVPSSVDELIAEAEKWRSIADQLAAACETHLPPKPLRVGESCPICGALNRYREAVG